jgi:hypothetical protein
MMNLSLATPAGTLAGASWTEAPARLARPDACRPPLAATASSTRDARIDFLRGLALLIIFVDHIPRNPLSAFTPQALGLSDAAEAFVFMSGLVCGMVYMRTLVARGWAATWVKVAKRCGQVYLANVAMLAATVAMVAVIPDPGHDGAAFQPFFGDPGASVRDALLLRFAPGLTHILDLYVVLLLLLPVGLWLHRRGRAALLVASFAVYAAAQCSILRIPGWFAGWYFNPLAWQLLFFVGVSIGASKVTASATTAAPRPRPRDYTLAATAAVALGLVLMAMHVDVAWGAGGSRPVLSVAADRVFPLAGKPMLEPVRAAHFLIVAYLCAALIPRRAAFFDGAIGRALTVTGRHSLALFCLGAVLSLGAGYVTSASGKSTASFVAVNLVGGILLIRTAQWLDALKARSRAAAVPVK